MKLHKTNRFDNSKKSYNLVEIYNSMKKNNIPKGCLSSLFDVDLLNNNKNIENILKQFIGYDVINKSLVVFLRDKEDIETIAIHRAKPRSDEEDYIKWKTLGSKNFIQYKINDDIIFIVYGMAEIILCELLDISYIAFQSDSIAINLSTHEQFQNDIKPLLDDKYIILLLDNDNSCLSTVNPIRIELECNNRIIPLEMIDLIYVDVFVDDNDNSVSKDARDIWKQNEIKQLSKGYDIRDFANNLKAFTDGFYDGRIKEERLKMILEKTTILKIKGSYGI